MTLPKRIWAVEEDNPWNSVRQGIWDNEQDGQTGETEYIRADSVDDWQPFETMPEDEFVLITFTNRWGYPRVHEAVKYTTEDGDEVVYTVYEQNVINSVTHWMPLPEPPKT